MLLQRDAKAFLTIQPTERFNQLKSIWDKQISQSGKKIVVAPIEIISSAQETQAKSIYFLSEESLIHLHIGGK